MGDRNLQHAMPVCVIHPSIHQDRSIYYLRLPPLMLGSPLDSLWPAISKKPLLSISLKL